MGNMQYFSQLLGVDANRGRSLLETVQLTPFLNRRVEQLSGGQNARLSLVTALVNNPPLLILDEPTVGLDPLLRRELWRLFSALAQQGTTLLVSSHVMDEAARCERLLLMREGRLLAEGSPSQLIEDTSSRTVEEAFLTLIDNETERRSGRLPRLRPSAYSGSCDGTLEPLRSILPYRPFFKLWCATRLTSSPTWLAIVVAGANALLGMAMGLFLSALAHTELQAIQFMPAFILP